MISFAPEFDQHWTQSIRQESINISVGEYKTYAVSVAKLGGYLDRNSDPPPGWQAMWKGLQKLRMWAEGYELAAEQATRRSFSEIKTTSLPQGRRETSLQDLSMCPK